VFGFDPGIIDEKRVGYCQIFVEAKIGKGIEYWEGHF
jgi:hypothetical protein